MQTGDVRAPREVDSSLDQALEAVCLKAMATKLEDRYASGRALAEDLERWAADEPVSAYREPFARRARRWERRHRSLVTGVAAAVLVAVGRTGYGCLVQRSRSALAFADAGSRHANRAAAVRRSRTSRPRAGSARFDLAKRGSKPTTRGRARTYSSSSLSWRDTPQPIPAYRA